jgi:hypothetical protein
VLAKAGFLPSSDYINVSDLPNKECHGSNSNLSPEACKPQNRRLTKDGTQQHEEMTLDCSDATVKGHFFYYPVMVLRSDVASQ